MRGRQEIAERAAGLLQSTLYAGGVDRNGVRQKAHRCDVERGSTIFVVHTAVV